MNIKDLLYVQAPVDNNQLVALKNVILVCKERLWLQETSGYPDAISDEFDSYMTEDQVTGTKQSIAIVERLLKQLNENNR